MPDIHPAARTGYAQASATYAAGRPDYPEAIAGWITGPLGLAPGRTAVDLGAGTGKFTARLAATGADVIAFEPVAEMRGELAAALPAVQALDGSAEAIPLPDASADALTCAQSFHWFANAAALAEIARVLKPGGTFGLIWNIRDETAPWVAELSRLMAPYEGETPRFHHGSWRRLFPDPRFSPRQETTFPHAHTGPFETVVMNRLMSVSFIAALPRPERAAFRAALDDLAARTPALADRTSVSFPYRTLALTMTRA